MMRLEFNGCPGNVQGGLERYVNDRVAPGGFLRAVLENDLARAIGRADLENLEELPDIVRYVYSHVPAKAWGSKDAVARWLVGDCRHGVSMADRCFDCDPNTGVEDRA